MAAIFFPELPATLQEYPRSSHGEPENHISIIVSNFLKNFEAFPEHSFLELFRPRIASSAIITMDCNAVINILSTIISRSVSLFSGKQSDKLIVALRRAFAQSARPTPYFCQDRISE